MPVVDAHLFHPFWNPRSFLQFFFPLSLSTQQPLPSFSSLYSIIFWLVKSYVIDIVLSGKKCKLLHWMGNGEVVAEAEVDCTDPQAVVHHMILGSDCWRVSVKKVLVSKVPLYRATTAFMIL
ncbi:hypothetical protein ACOSQ4_002879 [Xanthoceras sorbifolium]